MKKIFIAACIAIFVSSSELPAAAEGIVLEGNLSKENITTQVDYYIDKDKTYTIDTVRTDRAIAWERNYSSSTKFGYSSAVYWFRLIINNPSKEAVEWYLEINYPHLDYIDLYVPNKEGTYTVKQTGDHYHFSKRDVDYRNPVFILKERPGKHIYYLRVDTTSSINFSIIMWSPKAFIENSMNELPVNWMYYGLLLVMILYNLLISISVRDKGYVSFALYLTATALYQLALSGLAFEYLWPGLPWWANIAVPFSLFMSLGLHILFYRFYIETGTLFPRYDKILLFVFEIPAYVLAAASFLLSYSLAIRIATVLVPGANILCMIVIIILAVKKSRPARVVLIAFFLFVIGTLTYGLKSAGILPSNFFTTWSLQLFSALSIILLALGLADKINLLKNNLIEANKDLKNSEKTAKDRADFLQGVIETIDRTSVELLSVSGDLDTIGKKLTRMAMDEAADSEEMASSFEELTGATATITSSTIDQMNEVKKTRDLISLLQEAQAKVNEGNKSAMESISVISQATQRTENNLRAMIEKMNVLQRGGTAIGNFIALIDDISDRINLLSLNAAIEAARAGDAGKGFAVVADEIGKLADATSSNSKEISKEISRITNDINEGMKIVDETKNSTESVLNMASAINEQTRRVIELMDGQTRALVNVIQQAEFIDRMSKEIAVASREQTNSMEQMTAMVTKRSETAQELASHNEKVLELTNTIGEKSASLGDIVKKAITM
jgi:methyl-accepting chemotaxis protein